VVWIDLLWIEIEPTKQTKISAVVSCKEAFYFVILKQQPWLHLTILLNSDVKEYWTHWEYHS